MLSSGLLKIILFFFHCRGDYLVCIYITFEPKFSEKEDIYDNVDSRPIT